MKHSQTEAIPTSKLYIICEYASNWSEKTDSGLAQPERKRWWDLENEFDLGSKCLLLPVRQLAWMSMEMYVHMCVCVCDCVCE